VTFWLAAHITQDNEDTGLGILTAVLAFGVSAADKKSAGKPKPYPLKTCIVSDESLGGDHGEPYTFVHEGQEIKLCCKPCLKDFNKEPAKYLKKLEAPTK